MENLLTTVVPLGPTVLGLYPRPTALRVLRATWWLRAPAKGCA